MKITLKAVDPAVWRRVLVCADTPLADRHKIIQTVMGWTNSHLHQFAQKNKSYCLPHEDDVPDENRLGLFRQPRNASRYLLCVPKSLLAVGRT